MNENERLQEVIMNENEREIKGGITKSYRRYNEKLQEKEKGRERERKGAGTIGLD